MRLINSTVFEPAEFFGDEIPPYAILSHTWGYGEVELRDVLAGSFHGREGFAKLQGCCAQAANDGLAWVWIDTCCIDKSSSAELSEAINSMYTWYRNAEVCYVYLFDVPALVFFLDKHKFQEARWFTRGWCLQELIAPREVEFYAEDWTELGTKWTLQATISEITSIPASVLLHQKQPAQFPVAQRMSWASMRSTKREEDMAYCLLGIFDINMPLLYGEGKKAFIRLQQEILKREVDYSIFLWRSTALHDATGLLCDTPHCFPVDGVPIISGGLCKYSEISASDLPLKSGSERIKLPEVTPRGLEMTLYKRAYQANTLLAWIYLTYNGGLVFLVLNRKSLDHKHYRTRVGYVEVMGMGRDPTGYITSLSDYEHITTAIFTELAIPQIEVRTLDFKVWLQSKTNEELYIAEIYPPGYDLDLREGALSTELNPVDCPDIFFLLISVKDTQEKFVVAFNLFHTTWAYKIRKHTSNATLESAAKESWAGAVEDNTDRAISRLSSGSYIIVSAKTRARSSRAYLYITLIPAESATDISLPRTIVPRIQQPS
ncbi:unnamed protein product [Clonostachys byssicola]|uniref:Heterokaryon incompatibility domain-containing protein n=1 Tax=Clonostachys byssicola TaxID=160290 RepID=A0A9N9Y725_9HYPO|nr:unnamed protein product [Clonostachys byssicola]